MQRGYEVHVLDRTTDGPKPQLVADLGATYHTTAVTDVDPVPDIVVEATGAGQVVLDAMAHTGADGIVCLTGISSGGRPIELDAGALNRSSCSRTTSSSARSTRTAATTRQPPTRSPTPTAPGSSG